MSLSFEEYLVLQNEVLPEVKPQDLSGQVIIVTGANVGIGYETAKAIASMKPEKLILACRSLEKGAKAVASIKEATGYEAVETWKLDLASFASVRAFAKKFDESGLPLHVLINNAAISAKDWVLTDDGYESTIQTNHLSTMLLTLLLTPHLRRVPSPRVLIVSSETHFWSDKPAQSDATPIKSLLSQPSSYNGFDRYKTSKLLNVIFAQEFARRCPDIFACSINPGFTISELGTKDALTGDGGDSTPRKFGNVEQRPTREGAKTIVFCAVDPTAVDKSGSFFTNLRTIEANKVTAGEAGKELTGKVWRESMEIIQGPGELVVEQWMEN